MVGVHEYLMISQLTREMNFQDTEKSKRKKRKDSKITIEAAQISLEGVKVQLDKLANLNYMTLIGANIENKPIE
jgi:hypothetical protein